MSDEKQRRLASPNTMWPAGHISQAFAAVAVMQLYEDGRLDFSNTVGKWIQEVPEAWKEIEILQLLRHASGLPDYRFQQDFNPYRAWAFGELIDLVQALPLHFKPGTEVMQSATNFLLLTEIVERAGNRAIMTLLRKGRFNTLVYAIPALRRIWGVLCMRMFLLRKMYISCLRRIGCTLIPQSLRQAMTEKEV